MRFLRLGRGSGCRGPRRAPGAPRGDLRVGIPSRGDDGRSAEQLTARLDHAAGEVRGVLADVLLAVEGVDALLERLPDLNTPA